MKNGMLVMKDSPVNLAVPTVPLNVNHHVHEKSNINYSACVPRENSVGKSN
jgi:hypothetical protein